MTGFKLSSPSDFESLASLFLVITGLSALSGNGLLIEQA
jgi:hypothetical protein